MRLIDLSMPITDKPDEPQATEIYRLNHQAGAIHVEQEEQFMLPGAGPGRRLTRQAFPQQEFLSFERVSTSVHTGTHMDAPYHYGSQCEGRPARMIDEVPLNWCYGPAVVLDVRAVPARGIITRQLVEQAVQQIGVKLAPGTIVLLRTGCDRLAGSPAYFTEHPGVGVDALEWLTEQGVRTIGIDAFSFDLPFSDMVRRYLQDGDVSGLWPAHFFGRKREYLQIECLAHLDELPYPQGFILSCFPIKIARAGAGWVRAVALFPD